MPLTVLRPQLEPSSLEVRIELPQHLLMSAGTLAPPPRSKGVLAELATLGGATNLVNAPAWPSEITFDLLAGTNQIRNLHAVAPLSIQLANDNWTLSFACDAYSRGETDALLLPKASEAWVNNAILTALAAYSTTIQVDTAISDALAAYSSTAEMNTAISAIDSLNLNQYQNGTDVQFLIDQALLPYWDQTEVSSFVAGELVNYATNASVSSSIGSALSSYDNSSQVDSKIVTALLDFYTRAETDQAIADAVSGSVDLSAYYTSAETQSYVANELLAYYPRTELDSQLTATFTQYWTSSRTQTENDAISGAGFQTQADADLRYFVRAPGAESAQIFNLAQEQFTPRIIRNLLLEAPLSGDAILGNQSTLRLRCDAWTKAEADSRFLRTNDLGPLDARYFVTTPGTEGGGIFNLAQTQFIIRNLLCQSPLSAQPILGNGSTLQISCDCWSKGQSDGRYPLVVTFNSLGQRVTDLENSPGVDPTADLTVNSLTATSFVDTPLLQSAAADLQLRNATTTIRTEDGTLVASFAAGNIGLEQDITVRSDRTLPPRRISPNSSWDPRRPREPSPAAAPCRPHRRSRATSGSRHRWCAATRQLRGSPFKGVRTAFWWMTPCGSTA